MENYKCSDEAKEFYQLLDNLINPIDLLNKKKEGLKEAFIDYYGEEYREKISDKFDKVIILGNIMPSQIEQCCKKVSEAFKMYTFQKILDILNLENQYQELPIDKLDNVYLSYLEEDNKQMIEDIIDLYENQEYNISEIKEKIKQIKPLFKELDQLEQHAKKYIEVMSIPIDQIENSYNGILDELAGILDIERKTYKAYFYMCLLKQKDIYPNLIQDYLNKVKKLMNKYKSLYSSDFHYQLALLEQRSQKIMEKLFGDLSGENDGLIVNFSSDTNSLLKNENTPKWIKQKILEKRKEYLKLLNINIDEIDLQTLKEILPKEEDVDDLLDLKEISLILATKEICLSMELHAQNLKKLQAQFPIYTENHYILDIIHNTYLGWHIPGLFKTDQGYDERNLIMIFQADRIENLDSTLVHELNHCLETTIFLSQNSEMIFEGINGFDRISSHIYIENFEGERPEIEDKETSYELFNEIINEKLAQEITNKMHENGNYIFNFPNFNSKKGCSDYEFYNFLADDFYNEYKEKIIKSRLTGTFDNLKQELGVEDIELLNQIINQCSEHVDTILESEDLEACYDHLACTMGDYKELADSVFNRIKFNQIVTKKEKVKSKRCV